jgi:hypothetical protein
MPTKWGGCRVNDTPAERGAVTPDEAAMERAYNLTGRHWESWMDEAYRPSYNVAPSRLRTG